MLNPFGLLVDDTNADFRFLNMEIFQFANNRQPLNFPKGIFPLSPHFMGSAMKKIQPILFWPYSHYLPTFYTHSFPDMSYTMLHLIFQPFLLKSFFNLQEILHFFFKNKGTIFLSRLAGQVPSWWPWNSWTALVGAAPPMRWNPWTTPWPWELRRLGFTVGTILTEKVGEIEMFNEFFFCFFKWIIYGYMAYKMNPDIFLTCLSNNVILHFVRALNKNTFTLHTFTI